MNVEVIATLFWVTELMLKNYWYIMAFSAVISIIIIMSSNKFLYIPFVLWLLYLLIYKKLPVFVFIMSIVSLLFFYHYIPHPNTSHPQLNEEKIDFHKGKIVGPIDHSENKMEFLFQEEKLDEKLLVVYFTNQNEDNEDPAHLNQFQTGANCTLEGTLTIPEGARNPYQFDYQNYLSNQGLNYQLMLTSLENSICDKHSYLEYIYSLRFTLLNKSIEKLQPTTAAWMQALVLGKDELIDQEIIELFQRWSLSHILAISGLHIGIIVGILYFVMVRLGITTKENAQTFIMIFLPLYAILAGGEPSVWRASLMVLFVILIQKSKFAYSYTDVISIIFLILILINKYIVFHIGFQFSFAVTFGLIISSNYLKQTKTNTERILQISFISQMIILPLQIHYFSIFQPASILLNLIVVPYFSLFVIPLMFSFFILLFFPSFILQFIENYFLFIHELVLKFIQLIDTYANTPLIIGDFSIYYACIYYFLFFYMMMNLEKKNVIKSFQYGFCLALLLIVLTLRPYFSPIGTVTMLDIGQGDAYIIELPYRKGVFIVDAGASLSFPDFLPTDKVYRQIIKPYLQGRGIHKIDTIFLSHRDADHTGSIEYLIEDTKVDEIIISEFHESTEEEIKLWKKKGIEVYTALYNEVVSRKGQLFHVLSPKQNKQSDNENSLVLYTELGGKRWIFTGDAGVEIERQILQDFPRLSVEVLKVGHHGSNTSTDQDFVKGINAKYALISAGKDNRYGHPTTEVIETLESENVVIYRTDQEGAVQYFFKDNSGMFQSFLELGQ